MKPVDELSDAALRIDAGNFDELIQYKHNDEFAKVCDTFNTMQQHLKEGIEKTQKYEQARTEMVSGISHDLRTTLTSVKGYMPFFTKPVCMDNWLDHYVDDKSAEGEEKEYDIRFSCPDKMATLR